MKALILGDAVVPTGFAKCTHSLANYLHNRGDEVVILGVNYYGDPHPYPYPIYPCLNYADGCRDMFGIDRLPKMIIRESPDILVILTDPWHIPNYLDYLEQFAKSRVKVGASPIPDIPIVGWLAVDGENHRGATLNRLNAVVVWTEFAKTELSKSGYEGPITVSPLGVDTTIFKPKDKQECRSHVLPPQIPSDSFIVGVVGRNQHRKRLDLTLQYFSEWIREHNISNAYLYLHVSPTGDQGVDIPSLVNYFNLNGKVIRPNLLAGTGLTDELMCDTYNSFDVYITTTHGEGWGLPTLEAMACGVPCIVPNFSGLGSWAKPASLIPCFDITMTAPAGGHLYIIGKTPDKVAFTDELYRVYRNPTRRARMTKAGLELSSTLTWENSAKGVAECLDQTLLNYHSSRGPLLVSKTA